MSEKKNPGAGEVFGLLVLVVAFATLTYPIFVYSGLHDLLADLSVQCTKALFVFFNIKP